MNRFDVASAGEPEGFIERLLDEAAIAEVTLDHRRAAALYDRVLKLYPYNYEAVTARALLSVRLGELRTDADFGLAVAALLDAVAADPKRPEAYAALGEVHEAWGNPLLALAQFNRALDLDPDDLASLLRRARILTRTDRFADAVRDYRRTLSHPDARDFFNPPLRAAVHSHLGILLFRTGRSDEAVRHYRDAIRLDPQQPIHHFMLGVLFFARGDISRALAPLAEAVRLDPFNPFFADLHRKSLRAIEGGVGPSTRHAG